MYNKTLVILLAGKAGSGKSFAASYLTELFKSTGKNTTRDAFAKGIKDIARKYIGWDGTKDEKGRKLLQTLGTEVGREYNPDCWVEYLIHHLENTPGYPYDVIIIDDWRFPNEYEYFVDNPLYTVVKVLVLGDKNKISSMPKGTEKHASEVSLPTKLSYYDYTLYNTFSENDFEELLVALYEVLDKSQSKYGE